MRFDVRAMAAALGLLWGAGVLVVGLANVAWPDYGVEFLQVMASIYPGYQGAPGVAQSVVGAMYGLFDAAVGGAIFAWIYNLFAARSGARTT